MATTWRTVRVFISSTFRDMHAEREEVVERAFPQLRKLCEERGVVWSEVDLCWGITDEQSQRGEVLWPICHIYGGKRWDLLLESILARPTVRQRFRKSTLRTVSWSSGGFQDVR